MSKLERTRLKRQLNALPEEVRAREKKQKLQSIIKIRIRNENNRHT